MGVAQQMYSEVELNATGKQLKRVILITGGILVVFLAAAFSFMTQWPAWIGTIFLLFGVSICVFLWGIYGTPVYAYYRFVRDIVTGRNREVHGKVLRINGAPIYKDNKLHYYEITLEEDKVERLLLFDANLGTPPLELNTAYTFRVHENFIVEIQP